LIANHDQEHIALSDRIPDVLPKIDPERDIIEIKKTESVPKRAWRASRKMPAG